mmetsp:Transcript_5372/g.15792  ORF Transcript_5372/g.15792 Transcript_5372/m.15792 type:complete len:248 (-) Transcript_5372:241-984(-)
MAYHRIQWCTRCWTRRRPMASSSACTLNHTRVAPPSPSGKTSATSSTRTEVTQPYTARHGPAIHTGPKSRSFTSMTATTTRPRPGRRSLERGGLAVFEAQPMTLLLLSCSWKEITLGISSLGLMHFTPTLLPMASPTARQRGTGPTSQSSLYSMASASFPVLGLGTRTLPCVPGMPERREIGRRGDTTRTCGARPWRRSLLSCPSRVSTNGTRARRLSPPCLIPRGRERDRMITTATWARMDISRRP